MSESPLVSIIIPTYNRAHLIGETLDSILAQTYKNWECIVVDDGSTDNTDDVVGKYVLKDKRFNYYHRPEEHLPGGNGARNFGFKKSKGEYINWFDSDDVMKECFIALKVNCLKEDLDVVFCYGAYFNNSSDLSKVIPSKPDTYILNPFNYVQHKFHIHIAGPLWNRTFLKEKKLFDESRTKLQDVEFHFRMILNEPQYYFYPIGHLYLIRKTSNSISRKKISITKAMCVFSYHYLTFKSTPLVKKEIQSNYRKYTRIKALRAYYLLVCQIKVLKRRIDMYYSLSEKLKELIKAEPRKILRIRTSIVVLIITIFKKGFKLIR